ncbi:MAG: transketolase C-terminal domain-containing protein, partial [bacterium]
QAHKKWQENLDKYSQPYPDIAKRFKRVMRQELPEGWDSEIPEFRADKSGMATRSASGKILNALAERVPELIGGSADLTGSTKVSLNNGSGFGSGSYASRNIYYGVREHAMAGISNGMALHGGTRPFASTFLIFSDYMRPSIRLAAMMGQPVVYIFTHDSIGLGEDGPTHQPIEQLAALRAIPNLTVIRPCDANETAEAWKYAVRHTEGPVALALTRQNLPVLDRQKYASAAGLYNGAYVLLDPPNKAPELILIATGSEIWPTLQVGDMLQKKGIAARIVSMPSWEIFDRQPDSYREQVLPENVTARLAVEAGISLGWSKYIGQKGKTVAIDGKYGASASWQKLMQEYGFTTENILKRALNLI